MVTPLRAATLDELTIPVPSYPRTAEAGSIVHLGVGGFHRAHQAMYLDRLLTAGAAAEWGICGLGVLPQDARMRDALSGQDHLYTLEEKHPNGDRSARVVGSIVDYVLAPDDPAAAVARLADDRTRIVSLTITEGGYNIDNTTGEFIAETVTPELADPARPASAFGLVVRALERRRADGKAPFTVMSCDNIQGNGEVAKHAFASYAELVDPALANWIRAEVAFPSCMVDRITPATTDADRAEIAERFGIADAWPVVCEPFTQWVLTDEFPGGRPPWEDAGVQVVADVLPYEHLKLRLLNASHQAIAYFGSLLGHHYVHDAMADRQLTALLERYMSSEAAPTLGTVPGVDVPAYSAELISRFGNPAIADTCRRLAFDGSERIAKFLMPVVRDRRDSGQPVPVSAGIVAAWAHYCAGTADDGTELPLEDQRADRLRRLARDADPLAFLAQPDLFGDLAQDPGFTEPYVSALGLLQRDGTAATMAHLLADPA